ncbi:LOW QUALITY PROTEIN: polycystin family receptor for egg jelly-like [Cariama cristata]
MTGLRLLLLQLLCCWPQGSGAASLRLQPPPLLLTCRGPHGQVSQRHDHDYRLSCLWNSTVTLRYRPAPAARPQPARKQGWAPPPPNCSWHLNSAWLKNTSRWAGQVVLQTGLLPGSAPPPAAASLLTVQCSSASCAAPDCFHHNLTIQMTAQDMRLFVLWPQTRLIRTWQPVELGWCARLKSASWQYRFSSQGGSPSTLLIPSTRHQDAPPPASYPTAELQQTCATYYSYRLTVRYSHPGLHLASVSIEHMPQINLSLSLQVGPDLLNILSASSKLLSVPQQALSLSWRFQPLSPRMLAYTLVDTQATGGWLHSYSSFTLQSNFCAIATPQSLGEMVVASIHVHLDGSKRFEDLTGQLHLLNGTLSLAAGRETPTQVSLHPGKTNGSTYTFRYNHGTFHTTEENNSPISIGGPVVRYRTQSLLRIHIFSDQCLFLDGVRSLWREDTCRLGALTDSHRVHCVCNMKRSRGRLSVQAASNASTFDIRFLAAKVLVAPNILDLGKTLIADIPKNPVTLLTVLIIFALYFLASLWAVRKDRADGNSKDKIIALWDNDPFDEASFLVTLYTGSRWGAGTKADVFLQLVGQNGTSDVHCLRHPHLPTFRPGSIDCFLLTTKKDLGDVLSFRIWHNNKGPSPSWFLSRAKVQDMATGKTWFFMCRQWLSLDKGDRSLERTFFVTNPKTPLSRMDYFLINLANSLRGGHPWLSIFAHVPTGIFSRFQRLSVSLAMLLLDLLLNIMFFNADKNQEAPLSLRYLRSVTIGIQCALLTAPVELIIIALLKYSHKERSPRGTAQTDPRTSSPRLSGKLKNWKERLQKLYRSETPAQSGNISPLENLPGPSNSHSPPRSRKARSKGAPQNLTNRTDSEKDAKGIATEEQTTTANSPPTAKACQRRSPPNSNFSNPDCRRRGNFQKERKHLSITSVPFGKRPRRDLQWWSARLLWAIIMTAVIGLSAFFIVFYGLSYGYQTSLEWLLASSASFIEDVLFISTLKITFFSAVRTIRAKYCENITWLTHQKHAEIKLAKETMSAEEMREVHSKLAELRATKHYKPLEADEMANMLKKAKLKVKAFTLMKAFISHLVVLAVLFHLVYSTANANSFHYNRFIRNQISPQLSSVAKLEHIYVWVKDSFLPLIHNDIQPTFLPDSSSKIIGLPRMRQVRAKGTHKKCFHPHSFVNNFVIGKSHCLHKYGSDIPEKGDYAGTWTKVANHSASKDAGSYGGFTYQPNRAPWTYYSYGDLHTYGPAGYTFYFFPEDKVGCSEEGRPNSTTRLDALQQSNWLDEKTWAVIIELTTFNADTGLFCTISVIFEMSHLGIIKPSLSVHSFALPIFHQQTQAQMVVLAIVLAFLLIYIADELHIVGQEKKDYIKNISNVINFALKSAFLLFLVLKAIKFKVGEDIVKFYLLHPNHFIPFHAVAHLDQILRITMGVLTLLAVLKTLKYSRFLSNVRRAQRSILAALPRISSMTLVVVVYFFGFMAFGYLVFGQHERRYNNMIHSAQTVVSYCVSAFRDTTFSSNRLLGSLFLASFALMMICVVISLFRAVILSAYRDRKQAVYQEPSDEAQVVTFVVQSLTRIFYHLSCNTSKNSEPDLFHSLLYGQPERRHQQHLGLKNRKTKGEKMVSLAV